MKAITKTIIVFIIGLSFFFAGCGSDEPNKQKNIEQIKQQTQKPPSKDNNSELKWSQLNDKQDELYKQGKYEEGIEVAEKALKFAEESFGANHVNVATSLNNLAMLYFAQGKYDKAEPLYLRALEIREESLGEEHLNVVTTLENMAELYKKMNKPVEAGNCKDRVNKIREKWSK